MSPCTCSAAAQQAARRHLCKFCVASKRKAAARVLNPLPAMLRDARYRAKRDGIAFDITLDDLVLPTHCPILGTPLKAKTGSPGAHANSPSLDRLEPALGYTRGNCWVVSHSANMLKNNGTLDELIAIGRWATKRRLERRLK
jgi:hypothetical protein